MINTALRSRRGSSKINTERFCFRDIDLEENFLTPKYKIENQAMTDVITKRADDNRIVHVLYDEYVGVLPEVGSNALHLLRYFSKFLHKLYL